MTGASRHRPTWNHDLFRPRCSSCARSIHFVVVNWLVPITSPDDARSSGWWRHNPRSQDA